MGHTETPVLLTIKDFLGYVPIGRTSLYERMHEGAIYSITVGRRRLIPASEVTRLISSGTGSTATTG